MNTTIQIFEHREMRVLTTKQLADFYGTTVKILSQNFQRNQDRFKKSVHFFRLEGEELRAFRAILQNEESPNNLNILYLWTERGAARHAKMLNSDKAWEVFERLEETYFSLPEAQPSLPKAEPYSADVQAKINAIADEFTANIILPVYEELRRMQKQMLKIQAQHEVLMRGGAPGKASKSVEPEATPRQESREAKRLVTESEAYMTIREFLAQHGLRLKLKRAGNIGFFVSNTCKRRGIPIYCAENGHYTYPVRLMEELLPEIQKKVEGYSHAE